MDLRQLAEKAGISYNTLAGYTKRASSRVPGAARAIRLAHALGVSVEWLLDSSQGMPPPVRREAPPFPVYPWPPDGITWEEIQLAVAAYAYQKAIDRFYEITGGRGRLQTGREEIRAIRPDHFQGMEDSPLAILDHLRALQRAVEEAAKRQNDQAAHEPGGPQ